MAKKEKGGKPEKITNDQLNKMQNAVSEMNQLGFEVGQIEAKKHEMLHALLATREDLAEIKSEFEKEYGTSDVNIQTGEIRYSKDEQTN
jgi:hypothetical protein|tara:strand:- start:155 stop:421 length:267 start_codon:yes stop_codon:yes gene_type:complete